MNAWSEYERWNEAIADVVFAPSDETRPVYLDLEDDLVAALAEKLGIPEAIAVDSLCETVGETLNRTAGPAAVFDGFESRVLRWVRDRRASTPPFLALLATFSLAAEQMTGGDGMAANNYFGRLKQVLRWRDSDPNIEIAYRRVVERYWAELNGWLVQEEGARGTPTAYSLAHRYIGLSISQALVRGADREKLKDFFQTFGLAAGTDVAPGDLVPLLDSWIRQTHSPVTASLQRLWGNGQARLRIAEAAAVTLAAWDGSVDTKEGDPSASGGQLVLTLELSGFPRKRFALSALFYVPNATEGREASVLTAVPPTDVDLVPTLPGALGLGTGSSLHPDDVLSGILRIEDSATGAVLERRPKRLVVFREDELSRRWVEVQQAMLGDDLRLLVENGLRSRVAETLAAVARPGWNQIEPYPGQPDGWTLFTGVELFNHPGALIPAERMDDLSSLIPLTSSTLKAAAGFALPGSVRGKWHTAAPPEIRAVSDATDGFVVRLIELDRGAEAVTETLIAEWSDAGAGVVVEPLDQLGLSDGDFRVELVPGGASHPSSTTMIYLRSGDSRDERQWRTAEPLRYGTGLGVLGVETLSETGVVGHLVMGDLAAKDLESSDLPAVPTWSKSTGRDRREVAPMRITVPDANSCIRTGSHRELIEYVPVDARGRPMVTWSYGRCETCGLVKRYRTRLPRHGRREQPKQETQPAMHDLTLVSPTAVSDGRNWATAIDALFHVGGGSWSTLERVALQVDPSPLFVDQFARTLEELGHISIRRDGKTLRPNAWEISPTQLSGTGSAFVFTGYWPNSLYERTFAELADHGVAVVASEDEPTQYFADTSGFDEDMSTTLAEHEIEIATDAWRPLALVLPPLSEVLAGLPRQQATVVGSTSWFDVGSASWKAVDSYGATGAYRVRKFSTVDFVRSEQDIQDGTLARCTVQLGKHLAALLEGRTLAAYAPESERFVVPVGTELPGLFGRTLVAASGLRPVAAPEIGAIVYQDVPQELAEHVFSLLSR